MLAYGEILDFPSPGGANSSYTLTIPTPQMSCSKQSVDISETENIIGPASIEHFAIKWPRRSSSDGVTDPAILPNLTITWVSSLRWYNTFQDETSNDTRTWVPSGNVDILTCQPMRARLNLNVTYVAGIRHVSYATEVSQEAFIPKLGDSIHYMQKNGTGIKDIDLPETQNWLAEIREKSREWNSWAILDAAMRSLEFNCTDMNVEPSLRMKNLSTPGHPIGKVYNGCSREGTLQPRLLYAAVF
jgi:hypothetical protein